MRFLAVSLTACFLVAFSSALMGQATRNFEVNVSFDPDHSESVEVSIACDGGVPLEQAFLVSEGESVTFTVGEFTPDYSCVLMQAQVDGYDTAYNANGVASGEGCIFSDANLLVDNSCVISNTWSGFFTTTFEVDVEFTDDSPVGVEVCISCTGEASVSTVGDGIASVSSPAVFEVTWLAAVPAACTAKQVSVPEGYNRSEGDCLDVPMTTDPPPECTLKNYQRSVPVDVGITFLDGNPANVPVDLSCEDGMVVAADPVASNGAAAVFRVREFPHSGTACAARAALPDGYELADSTCTELAVAPGGDIACSILSAPVTPLLPDPAAITGSWYSPDSSGEGFMIHSVSEDLAVGYFYGYDSEGGRLWLVGVSEGPFEWGEPALFEAQYAMGGSFGGFDPGDVARVDWGLFTVTLWDCDRATIEMLGKDGEKLTHVVRLAATSGTPCAGAGAPVATDAVTGSWFEDATSGQGFSVHKIDADSGVVYFYGFDENGGNLWLTGTWQSEWDFGDVLMLEMLQASGGTFGQVDPELVLREPWGRLELRFDDCTSGWARLEGIDGMQELDLDLLAGSLGLECVQ